MAKKIERYKVGHGDVAKLAKAASCSPLTVRLALNGAQDGPVSRRVIEIMKKDFVYYKM